VSVQTDHDDDDDEEEEEDDCFCLARQREHPGCGGRWADSTAALLAASVVVWWRAWGAQRVARDHPDAVVLVRVGDFYMAHGLSAVMLVEHGRLNPMGSYSSALEGCRAGAPWRNVQVLSLSLSLSLSPHTLSCWRSLDFAELLVHSKKSLSC
jgi:hypothetical protein